MNFPLLDITDIKHQLGYCGLEVRKECGWGKGIAGNVDFIRPTAFFLNNFFDPVLQGSSTMMRTESTVFYREQNTQ